MHQPNYPLWKKKEMSRTTDRMEKIHGQIKAKYSSEHDNKSNATDKTDANLATEKSATKKISKPYKLTEDDSDSAPPQDDQTRNLDDFVNDYMEQIVDQVVREVEDEAA